MIFCSYFSSRWASPFFDHH